MIINIMGYAEKRHILYALAKVLETYGDVLVVSPNIGIKRVIGGGKVLGHTCDILWVYYHGSPEKVYEYIQYRPEDFDFVIFDTEDIIIDNQSFCIYTLGADYEEYEKEFIEEILSDEKDVYFVKNDYGCKREKGKNYIKMGNDIFTWFEKVESYKILDSIKNKDLELVISNILTKYLQQPVKSLQYTLEKRWKY